MATPQLSKQGLLVGGPEGVHSAAALLAAGVVSSAAVLSTLGEALKGRHVAKLCGSDQLETFTEDSLRALALRALLAQTVTAVQVVNEGVRFVALPPQLGYLTAVQELDLSGNAIAEQPAAIGRLQCLRRLVLARNRLTSLPAEIGQLGALEELDVGRNQLASLPAQIGDLRALRFLNLMANQLTEIPPEIGNLSSLYRLGLKSNKLRSLPASMGRLKGLVELFLTDNQLERLPEEMCHLSSLVKLQASFNRLEALPEELCRLPNLELLRVAVNRVSQVPPNFGEFKKLSWFSLGGNPACAAAPPAHPGLKQVDFAELALAESLGEGASGDVFAAAWHKEDVVFKRFKAETSPDGHASDEIAVTCAVDHSNLIKVLGVVEEPRGLLMRRIYGRALAEKPNFESLLRCRWGAGHSFTLSFALNVARGVAAGLESLHSQRICHGDVYAHNVVADEAGCSVLCDYGASFCYGPGLGAPFEAQEVRAYGLLLNDLVRLTREDDKCSGALETLRQLVQECLCETAAKRPRFAEIHQRLWQVWRTKTSLQA